MRRGSEKRSRDPQVRGTPRQGRARRAALAVAALLVALAGVATAGDPKPDPRAEDPPLEGEAKTEHEKSVKQIVKFLRGEKNREVVRAQIESLGTSGKREERDALIEFSRGNPNQEFVDCAFQALAKIAGTTVMRHLSGKDALLSGEYLIQISAAQALEKMRDDRALPALLTTLDGKMTKIEVQGACLQALSTCGKTDARASDALFRYAAHKHDTVRANALESIGRLGTDAAYALLVERLKSEKNTRCRGAAATGLGRSGRRDAIPLLEKALAEDDAVTVRECATRALAELKRGK